MLNNAADTFLQEADELLSEIEAAALSMTSERNHSEAVNQIFRAFHTIKGSGAMFGFDEVAGFTHHVETLLDKVRDGAVAVTQDLSELILAATDHIKLLLQSAQGGKPVSETSQAALLTRVRQLCDADAPAAAPSFTEIAATDTSEPKEWLITFRPEPSLLSCGGNPVLLFKDLRKLGDCIVQGHIDKLPDLAELQTDVCYLWWSINLKSAASLDEIRDVFLFVEDGSDLDISPVINEPAIAKSEAEQQGSTMLANAASEPDTRGQSVAAQPREALVRVPAARLDRLVNLVGELVMNQSRLTTAASRFQSPELSAPVEEIERLVAELRDDVLQIRMMPIGTIFGRFRRLVHDLSLQLGKQIELITEGEETELDKSILDQLGEPLVHLLRNSIDHGIGTAADRVAKGKPATGTIRLIAAHRGSDVVISIEDDGKGLDRSAIRAKAIAKQMISPDAHLTDKEILNLILLPGFSTAATITSVSGRGVGMDVVKRQIDALRGTLNVTSESGQGTCVSLTLPLTLAIIDGLLVEAGETQYIIPMAVVTENVELSRNERAGSNGRNLVAVRGELVPYIDLREAFHMHGDAPVLSKIVLAKYENQRIGIVVDRVLGTHQTVIQPLGPFFQKIDVVSGTTVMGDGRVALILDVTGVVRLGEQQCQPGTSKRAFGSPVAA